MRRCKRQNNFARLLASGGEMIRKGKLFRQNLMVSMLVLLSFSVVSAQKKAPQAVIDEAERITRDKFEFFGKTPRGITIYAVKKPVSEMLVAIDKGFTDLFATAKKFKYKKRLKYKDYTVFIANADRRKDSQGNYSPDIAIPAYQYAGTIYDQGGYIYVAGMVLSFEPCVFVIGEHTRDYQRVSDVVRFEGEHIILFHNDRQRYLDTTDHSRGGSHPILQ